MDSGNGRGLEMCGCLEVDHNSFLKAPLGNIILSSSGLKQIKTVPTQFQVATPNCQSRLSKTVLRGTDWGELKGFQMKHTLCIDNSKCQTTFPYRLHAEFLFIL